MTDRLDRLERLLETHLRQSAIAPASAPAPAPAGLLTRIILPATSTLLALSVLGVIGWQIATANTVSRLALTQENRVLPFIDRMETRLQYIDRIPDILTALEKMHDQKDDLVSQTELDNALARLVHRMTQFEDEQTRRTPRITDMGQRISVLEDDMAEHSRFIREQRERTQ